MFKKVFDELQLLWSRKVVGSRARHCACFRELRRANGVRKKTRAEKQASMFTTNRSNIQTEAVSQVLGEIQSKKTNETDNLDLNVDGDGENGARD